MRVYINNGYKQCSINLPCKEKEIAKCYEDLGLENSTKSKVTIGEVYINDDLSEILMDKETTLDELNFFMKYFDSLSKNEIKTFYAVATAKKLDNMKDLINLTQNTNCYNLVDDFSNLNELGKNLYLNQKGSVLSKVLKEFDGKSYVENIIRNNPTPLVSKHGFIYPNSNEEQNIYNGQCFPSYWYKPCPITMCLDIGTDREFLYLPCEQSEIDKALERLEIDDISKAELNVEDYDLTETVAEFIFKDLDLEKINDFASLIKEKGSHSEIDDLIAATKISTVDELKNLIDSQYEFEIIPNVHSTLEYGRHMIIDSGRYEYDENLENYIDFNKYGIDRILEESGAFTLQGYVAYKGYNQDMINILNKNLHMNLENTYQPQEMKLYVPLKIVSYDEETDYGYYEKSNYEEEISPQELVDYEEEINDYIKNYQKDLPKRGLMEYYSPKDSVNAKVQRYDLSVETVKGELMGVMNLQLNAPLTAEELEKFKSTEVGQLSDGLAEGLEQQDIKCDGRDYNISFWSNDDNWKISTADDLGLNKPVQTQGFTMKGMW
ncbi:MAG: antirestriction protein ArdA [Clostridia bacterium]